MCIPQPRKELFPPSAAVQGKICGCRSRIYLPCEKRQANETCLGTVSNVHQMQYHIGCTVEHKQVFLARNGELSITKTFSVRISLFLLVKFFVRSTTVLTFLRTYMYVRTRQLEWRRRRRRRYQEMQRIPIPLSSPSSSSIHPTTLFCEQKSRFCKLYSGMSSKKTVQYV